MGLEPMTTRLKGECSTTELQAYMEQVKGIEPSSSAWKADILAVIRHLHIRILGGALSFIGSITKRFLHG